MSAPGVSRTEDNGLGSLTTATPQSLSCVATAPGGNFPPEGSTDAPTLSSTCLVSLSPDEHLDPLGVQHTVTLICGQGTGARTGPAGGPYPPAGCYDVRFYAQDGTTGDKVAVIAASCAGTVVGTFGVADCSTIAPVICPAGLQRSSTTGQCQPCPPAFTYAPGGGGTCSQPYNGTCAGTTINNAGGTPIECVVPVLSDLPIAANEATATIQGDAPHDYLIFATGFIGTAPDGSCPTGTTPASGVTVGHLKVAACQFQLLAQEKYIETTSVRVVGTSSCGGDLAVSGPAVAAGLPCFFVIKVTGIVVLKSDVNCNDGSEPATGTPVNNPIFHPDPVTHEAPYYHCENSDLIIDDVPVPNVPIQVTASNGVLATDCIPPVLGPNGGSINGTPQPTGTVTPQPTPTAGGPLQPPNPITAFEAPANCAATGRTEATYVTDQNGLIGYVGNTVQVSATTLVPSTGSVLLTGDIGVDGTPLSGAYMFGVIFYPSGPPTACTGGQTDTTGTASCAENYLDGTYNGELVPADVQEVDNCEAYGVHTYFYANVLQTIPSGTFSLPAQNGICLLRSFIGQLTVTASLMSTLNTQPSVTSGAVVLGTYGNPVTAVPTPAPAIPTNTPVPTASVATPVASATVPALAATATSTATSTPVPTPTSTPTPMPTATAVVHRLRISLDAARVDSPGSKAKLGGLDSVLPGQTVWLMMYYTIADLKGPTTHTSTYTILSGGQALESSTFRDTDRATGRIVRYATYRIPEAMVPGVYRFEAELTVGGRTLRASWWFIVARVESLAP